MLALATKRLFLPLIFVIVALVLTNLSPTFALVKPLVLELGRVIDKLFRNGDDIIKDALSIKFHFDPILEAILKVEERVFVRHISDLKHKGSEVFDVITNITCLLESTYARSHFLFCIA